MPTIKLGQVRPVNKGVWSATKSDYIAFDWVAHKGIAYIALKDVPVNYQPDSQPDYWAVFGAKGVDGEKGADGADGARGPQGEKGIQGVQGAQGPVGPVGPVGPKGADGPAGMQGAQGPVGPVGPVGPKGAQGPAGIQGPVGPAVPLSDSITSASTTDAASSKAIKTVSDKVNTLAATNGTGTVKGLLSLSDAVDSASGVAGSIAATPLAVRIVRDYALKTATDTALDMGWKNTLNYTTPCIRFGSNGKLYVWLKASGPAVTGVGAKDPAVAANAAYWVDYAASTAFAVGHIYLSPQRSNALQAGSYFCNGTRFANTSPAGKVLSGLPATFRTDWGITNNGTTTNVPNLFYSDGRGYFLRTVNGTTRQVGSVELDALQEITGEFYNSMGFQVSSVLSGALYTRKLSTTGYVVGPSGLTYEQYALTFSSARSARTATETRSLNIGMIPCIFLGV